MKNVKKVLALMLALVMCMGMFAGCVQEDVNETQGTKPSVNNVDIHPSLVGKSNAERYPLESSKTFTVANRMETPNEREVMVGWNEVTGVDVNWIDLKGDQLSQVMAGGDMPDAICISWGVDKNVVYEYGKAGKLVNFAEYLQYMPNFQKMLQAYPHALDNYLTEDGSFYSLPAQSAGIGSPANLLYVRSDMVEEAGLTMPTTIDEFKQFILDMQKYYEGKIDGFKALNFLMGGEWGYIEWNGFMDNFFFPVFGKEALQTGYDLVDGKVVLGCTTEQYKRYIEFISWVYASGACEQDIFSADCTAANKAKTANNQAAIFPASSVNANNFKSGVVELSLIQPLTSQWQDQLIWTNNTVPGWMLNCITAELPEEDLITLVLWFDAAYATEEDPLNEEGTIYGNYLYLGEKNVHWRETGEGTYERINWEEYKSPSEWANNEVCNTAMYLSWFQDVEKANTAFYCKQIEVRDKLWPHLVERWSTETLFLTEDESLDAADVNTELNLYMESAFAKFMTGEWTVEKNWTEYMNGLESIGALDLVETYQAAYDRHN